MDGAIRIRVDPSNPGQFFACCGLHELADRLWSAAEGWFENGNFLLQVSANGYSLSGLVSAFARAPIHQLDESDDYASPIELPAPFRLRLDWWTNGTEGSQLKVWAGSMRNVRIASAMQAALRDAEIEPETLLDYGAVIYDPAEPDKKVEPFYFDARRGSNARSIDIGYAPDALRMTNVAYPAVEFLCFIGLQRFRPAPTETRRVFNYHTWKLPLPVQVAPSAAAGLLGNLGGAAFRFEIAFRTDQRKHKAFTPATVLNRRDS